MMSTVTSDRLAAKVVSPADWLKARKELLIKEKEFTRQRDELSQRRRELPWEKVEKNYLFEGPKGKETLADLFEGRSQLIVYHFMFGPDWKEGCPSCSFLADSFNGAPLPLAPRDATVVGVSRATLPQIEAFKKRMGWGFKWLSSFGSDFNSDYQVSSTKEEQGKGKVYYNYTLKDSPSEERPGLSVFYKNEDGHIFHTYSTYERGLDILVAAYQLLDITAKGRDEGGLSYPMAWVRHHDRYGDGTVASCCAGEEVKKATALDSMLGEFREEAATTRRVLDRIPSDKLGWKPHPKSMTLGD